MSPEISPHKNQMRACFDNHVDRLDQGLHKKFIPCISVGPVCNIMSGGFLVSIFYTLCVAAAVDRSTRNSRSSS